MEIHPENSLPKNDNVIECNPITSSDNEVTLLRKKSPNPQPMKYTFRIVLITTVFFAKNISAQTILNDSAIMGPGYATQVFYDIKTGAKATSAVNNWDIAHTSVSRDNCIRANHMSGLRVFQYPKGKTDAWSSFDTTGWTTWSMLWNDVHDHNKGAFSLHTDLPKWKFGWGTYDVSSKEVIGDSLYLLAWVGMTPGTFSKFVKFWPVIQKANGDLIIKYANLDGSGETTDTLFQTSATGKMYKYFKFTGTRKPDREPISNDWDITFNRYFDLAVNPGTGVPEMYPVMGIESKRGTRTAKVFGKTFNTLIMERNWLVGDYTKSFKNDLTGIGSNWKMFNNFWSLSDTMSYLVERIRTSDTSYWLLNMTGFSGSSTGKINFSRTELRNSLSVNDKNFGSVKIFPNPASNQVLLTLDLPSAKTCQIMLKSMEGKTLKAQTINAQAAWNAYSFSIDGIPAGIYIMQIQSGRESMTQKLVIE